MLQVMVHCSNGNAHVEEWDFDGQVIHTSIIDDPLDHGVCYDSKRYPPTPFTPVAKAWRRLLHGHAVSGPVGCYEGVILVEPLTTHINLSPAEAVLSDMSAHHYGRATALYYDGKIATCHAQILVGDVFNNAYHELYGRLCVREFNRSL